jgi:hypothetical protein
MSLAASVNVEHVDQPVEVKLLLRLPLASGRCQTGSGSRRRRQSKVLGDCRHANTIVDAARAQIAELQRASTSGA